MAFSRWATGTQYDLQNPNPSSGSNASIYTHHNSYFPQHSTQNPNPNMSNPHNPHESQFPGGFDSTLRPPGIESYAHAPHGGYEALTYAHQTFAADTLAASSAYYQNMNAQNWVNPLGYEAARKNGTWKKTPKKVVPHVYCEICKLEMNSHDVYAHHILGKKHKKNLEMMNQQVNPAAPAPAPVPALTPAPAPAPAPVGSSESSNPAIGPQENPNKKKASKPVDLEAKKRKIVEGGVAVNEVRTCAICNVVCNSAAVFNSHIAGQKHAAKLKIYTATAGAAVVATTPS